VDCADVEALADVDGLPNVEDEVVLDEGLVEDVVVVDDELIGEDELIDDGLLLLVVELVDVLLNALPAALVMAVTDAHWLRVVSAFTLAVAVVPDAVALTSAFLSALHVRSTKSPILMSLRAETALPCTGSVMVPGKLADALVEAASLTVIVFELASMETTSAPITDASFFLSDLSSTLASTFVDSSVMRAGSEAVPFSFVLVLESCWAMAVPETRTRPSSRVSFFMFPPVESADRVLATRAVDDDLEEPRNRLKECGGRGVADYDFHTSIVQFIPSLCQVFRDPPGRLQGRQFGRDGLNLFVESVDTARP
jgi:hypothetical protein